MVGDVHRTFMYGGVFGYPADTKNKNGKLRLVYEAAPIAFLVEQAGGIATTGTKRVMDIVPEEVHQRLPVILGSKKPLQEVLDAYESKASAPEIPAPLPYTPRKPFVNAPETPKSDTYVAPKITAACEHTGVTLTRFMLEVAKSNPDFNELPTLFSGISTACKAIANLVKRSQLTGMTGYEGGGGSINVQGEEQKKLDVLTNDVLKKALYDTGKLGVLASEEEDVPVDVASSSSDKGILVDEGNRYVAVFDPLDGSSNVDAGIATGTIFGIYEHDETCPVVCDGDECTPEEARCLMNTLQPGNKLVASGYALYSSSTFFVFTFGAGVYGFTLDENIGEFVLTHPDIKIPEEKNIYSMNEANLPNWDGPLQKVVQGWQTGTGATKEKFTSRYMGSMVGDVHRTFMYGGVFGYPADTKNKNGKLRLVYEAAPIAFLVEQAGGIATTGTKSVMSITPEEVHQRVPVILGSKKPLQEVLDAYSSKASAPEIPAPLPYVPRKPFVNAPETPKSDTYVAPKITAACEHTGVTLTRFMLEVAKSNPDFNELPTLFSGIATACKAIANLVKLPR